MLKPFIKLGILFLQPPSNAKKFALQFSIFSLNRYNCDIRNLLVCSSRSAGRDTCLDALSGTERMDDNVCCR